MIQRIQTIYLLIAILLLSSIFFTTVASITGKDFNYEYTAFGLSDISSLEKEDIYKHNPAIPLCAFIGTAIALLIISLFLFKKRKLQILLNWLCFALIILMIGYLYYNVIQQAELLYNAVVLYRAGLYLAVASLPLIFLANRSIKKDENLIKSLDRIR